MATRHVECPAGYRPILDTRETRKAIRLARETFGSELMDALNLESVSAPLVVLCGTGVNDDLNGVERPVRFSVRGIGDGNLEIVQSLAKWKRLALAEMGSVPGEGICADLHAIRPDEDLDCVHSLYVDQWEWEQVIHPEERSIEHLKAIVSRIYAALVTTEEVLAAAYPLLGRVLPPELTFIHAEDLYDRYPDRTPGKREDAIARESGAVFVIGVGAALSDGEPHDGRAPDYDDWITPNGRGRGLNGDIIVWHPVINRGLELSSMGIRVDRTSLLEQLRIRGLEDRSRFSFHRRLLAGELPLTAGGGIGQSRVCMFLLRRAHIGEVQASVWPERIRQESREQGIPLMWSG